MNDKTRTVYLVRHAKSSWKEPGLSDRERPLNGRGRRNAPDMGRRMHEQGHLPEQIISSPANRALTTARTIAGEIGFDPGDIHIDERLYFSGTGGMRDVLSEADDDCRSVMMVGHNPNMTQFMSELGNTHVYNMPTCAIAVIGIDIDSWSQLHAADGVLLGYDYPKGSGSFTDGNSG